MFVRCVRAVAIHSQPVKHWHVKGGRKVTVRSPADRALFKVKAEPCGNVLRVMK